MPRFLSDLRIAAMNASSQEPGGNGNAASVEETIAQAGKRSDKKANAYNGVPGTTASMCAKSTPYVRVGRYCLPLPLHRALVAHHECDYRLLAHGRQMRAKFPGLVNVISSQVEGDGEHDRGGSKKRWWAGGKISLPPVPLPDGHSLERC